jgi:hypothetical protein
MKGLALGAGLTVLVAASSYAVPALAEDPDPSDPPQRSEPEATAWYGWQTLIADVPAVLLTVGALTQLGDGRNGGLATGLLGTAVPLFVLAPPFVHGGHDRWGVAAGDFLLRGAVTAVSAFLGLVSSIQNDIPCPGGAPGHCTGPVPLGTSMGIVAGMGAVAAVDASALAREPATAGSALPRPPQARWSPVVGVTPGGGRSFGVVGTF